MKQPGIGAGLATRGAAPAFDSYIECNDGRCNSFSKVSLQP